MAIRMTYTANPTRRRRFRFSLRTMFLVVTLFACLGWLAREWQFVQQRLAVFKFIEANEFSGLLVWSVEHVKQEHGWWDPGTDNAKSWPVPTIPFWRVWLGDRAVAVVLDEKGQRWDELHRLFPEARDFVMATLEPLDPPTRP